MYVVGVGVGVYFAGDGGDDLVLSGHLWQSQIAVSGWRG